MSVQVAWYHFPLTLIILYFVVIFLFLSLCSGPGVVYGRYASTSNAFIFSLRNEESLGPFKSAVTYPPHAIYRSSKSGPVFGAGHDIYIANNANSNVNSYTYFGHYYHVPSGVQDKNTVLAGTYKFTPDEVEVFYLGIS